MADQRGRCVNVEYCPVAVTRRIVSVPEGAPFTCERCGEPLESAAATRVVAGKRLVVALQALVVIVFVGAIAYKLTRPPAPAPREPAEVAAPASALAAIPAPASAAVQPRAELPPDDAAIDQIARGPADPEPAVIALNAEAAPAPEPAPGPAPGLAPGPASDPEPALPQPAAVTAPPAPPPAPPVATPLAPLPPPPPVPTTVLLRVGGADPVAGKLASRLAAGYLAVIGDSAITAEPSGPDGALDVSGLQAGRRELIRVTPLSAADPSSGARQDGTDVAISFRRPATRPGAPRGAELVIGVQGIGVVVSPSNRIASLTTGQLRGVLTGRIVNWSELGGRDAPITLHVLNGEAGFGPDLQEQLLLSADSAVTGTHQVATEAELAAAVADDPNGLGILPAGNAGRARPVAVARDGAPPLLPGAVALTAEEYPLVRRLYLHSAGDGSNGFVRRFEAYVASAAGRAAVEAEGFATLPAKPERAPAPDAAAERVRQLIPGSTRLSADLRFYPGSVQLDARSGRDLERLVAALRDGRISAGRLILAGFTDNLGPPAAHLAVSQRRAQAVVAALARYGVVPGETAGFGSDLPVGDNATPEGRDRNRRVEIYLAP